MFVDSYFLYWTLKNENDEIFTEEHNGISLSDFEVIYGNNTHEIIYVELRQISNVEMEV